MFIWTLSRKKAAAAVIAMGVVMAVLIVLVGNLPDEEPQQPLLTDNAARVEYLQSLGWEVEPEPVETLQFLLPDPLTQAYLDYNAMQIPQGFDLSTCLGKPVSRFTYAVTNYPEHPQGIQLNLYLCEDLPVAGDVCCPGADGFQEPLLRDSAEK